MIWTILAVLTFAAAAVGIYLLAVTWNPELDAMLCPVDALPTEEVIVVLDATDEWNAVQRQVVSQEFRRLQESIPRFARLSLFTLSAGQGLTPTPDVQLCNPGREEDFHDFPFVGRLGAALVGNPAQMRTRWNTAFVVPLERALSHEVEQGGAPRSLLMETIRGAAIEVFGSDVGRAQGRKLLILFSDLLQNSSSYSHYVDERWDGQTGRALGEISVLGTAYLEGAEVEVYLLNRDIVGSSDGHSRTALVNFWDGFLAVQRAQLTRVRRIEG